MELILVRHGETQANKLRLIQGWGDSPLTKKGVRQAHHAASRLRYKKIDAIYSSDLGRAKVTAEEIAKHHKLKAHYTKALREKGMGELEGTQSDFKVPLIAMKTRKGESLHQFVSRVKRFLDRLHASHKRGTVLIVTHKQVIRVMMALLMDRPIIEEKAPTYTKKLSNASIQTLDYGRPLAYTHEY